MTWGPPSEFTLSYSAFSFRLVFSSAFRPFPRHLVCASKFSKYQISRITPPQVGFEPNPYTWRRAIDLGSEWNAQNSFTHFDKSGTKKLNKREALECLAYAGYGDVDQKAIEHACRAFDPDRSNDLGIDQFIGLFLFLAAARKVFESFDADKSGKITLDLNQFIYASAKTR